MRVGLAAIACVTPAVAEGPAAVGGEPSSTVRAVPERTVPRTRFAPPTQVLRANSQLFAGKHGFITPRDLFKWANRNLGFIEDVANHGFMLLGERCRRPEERAVVKQTIEKECGVLIDEEKLYDCFAHEALKPLLEKVKDVAGDIGGLVWTGSLKRLFTLVGWCMKFNEPFVLVGDTGGGKTTVCQLYAALNGSEVSPSSPRPRVGVPQMVAPVGVSAQHRPPLSPC